MGAQRYRGPGDQPVVPKPGYYQDTSVKTGNWWDDFQEDISTSEGRSEVLDNVFNVPIVGSPFQFGISQPPAIIPPEDEGEGDTPGFWSRLGSTAGDILGAALQPGGPGSDPIQKELGKHARKIFDQWSADWVGHAQEMLGLASQDIESFQDEQIELTDQPFNASESHPDVQLVLANWPGGAQAPSYRDVMHNQGDVSEYDTGLIIGEPPPEAVGVDTIAQTGIRTLTQEDMNTRWIHPLTEGTMVDSIVRVGEMLDQVEGFDLALSRNLDTPSFSPLGPEIQVVQEGVLNRRPVAVVRVSETWVDLDGNTGPSAEFLFYKSTGNNAAESGKTPGGWYPTPGVEQKGTEGEYSGYFLKTGEQEAHDFLGVQTRAIPGGVDQYYDSPVFKLIADHMHNLEEAGHWTGTFFDDYTIRSTTGKIIDSAYFAPGQGWNAP